MAKSRRTGARSKHTPRKLPRRRSAQVLVDALVEATAELLSKNGYGQTTTNHIAERAGVSVGSLYQYFSSKQGLVAEVAQRQHRHFAKAFRSVLDQVTGKSLSEATVAVASTLLGEESGDLRLRQTLLDTVPRQWTRDVRLQIEDDAVTRLAEELQERGAVARKDATLRAFVIVHVVQAVIEGTVWRRRHVFAPEDVVRELARLVTRYLA